MKNPNQLPAGARFSRPLVMLVAIGLGLAGCGPFAEQAATSSAPACTATPIPTLTSTPPFTATPIPTVTSRPTFTPTPNPTPDLSSRPLVWFGPLPPLEV